MPYIFTHSRPLVLTTSTNQIHVSQQNDQQTCQRGLPLIGIVGDLVEQRDTVSSEHWGFHDGEYHLYIRGLCKATLPVRFSSDGITSSCRYSIISCTLGSASCNDLMSAVVYYLVTQDLERIFLSGISCNTNSTLWAFSCLANVHFLYCHRPSRKFG